MLYYILLTATLHRMGLCRCESLATFRHHLHWGYQLGAHHERRWEETTYETAARDDCFWTSFVYIVVRFYLYFCMLYFVCSTCRFTFFKWGVIMIHDISCYYSLCNWNYLIETLFRFAFNKSESCTASKNPGFNMIHPLKSSKTFRLSNRLAKNSARSSNLELGRWYSFRYPQALKKLMTCRLSKGGIGGCHLGRYKSRRTF